MHMVSIINLRLLFKLFPTIHVLPYSLTAHYIHQQTVNRHNCLLISYLVKTVLRLTPF